MSYIAAQLFRPVAARHFSPTIRHATGLKVSSFKLLKPTAFLVALQGSPTPLGQNVVISQQDHVYYKALEEKIDSLERALKEMDGRSRKGVKGSQDVD